MTPPSFQEFAFMDWAWLGYALFHPHTESSRWCNLDIYLDDTTSAGVQILQLMATRSHLTSIENNTLTPTTSFYHTATLCDHTKIHTEPKDAAEVVFAMDGFKQVCLCVDDPSALGTWVRVVAPGLGFGWILASSILEIVSRPPSEPSIQALRLGWSSGTATDAIVRFISVVGTNLKTLDLDSKVWCGFGRSFNAEAVHRMLVACPALTSLCVSHDGLVCHGELVTQKELPPLEHLGLFIPELEQFVAPSSAAEQSSLRNLAMMHIIPLDYDFCFEQSQRRVVSLLESHRRLQFFHWSDDTDWHDPRAMVPSLKGRLRTHKHLGKLSTRALSNGFASFSVECQLAFFSVASSTRDGKKHRTPVALGRIDQNIAVQIFAFATSVAPRELCIEGY